MIDSVLLMLKAGIIIFMAAGFSIMTAGFTRAKNSGDVMLRFITGFGISILSFIVIGKYLLFFGREMDVARKALMAAIIMSIYSGAWAGRMKFSMYLITCFFISAVVYPLCLSLIGFFDLAGASGLGGICLTGGTAAFIGAKILEPRLGKYTGGGLSKAIPGHNIPLGALGILVILVSWFFYISIGLFEMDLPAAAESRFAVNLIICLCAAGTTTFLYTWIRYKKSDITVVFSGFLAGLVAGSTGAGSLSLPLTVLLSLITGVAVVISIEYVDKVLKVDDPVGASTVFGLSSIIGILFRALFSIEEGVFSGGGFRFMGKQLLGTAVLIAGTALVLGVFLTLLKKTFGIRLKPEDEIEGLDLSEHGLVNSYYDFAYDINTTDYSDAYFQKVTGEERKDAILKKDPYAYPLSSLEPGVISKIEIITRKEKFDHLKTALNDIGITGMTVSSVSGYGVQKGYNEFYRGVPMDVQLKAKIRIEIVVTKVPVEEIVNTARKILYTGYIGDGKIFVYTINDVIRVRTGETGIEALKGMASESENREEE